MILVAPYWRIVSEHRQTRIGRGCAAGPECAGEGRLAQVTHGASRVGAALSTVVQCKRLARVGSQQTNKGDI
ncbi:hypothetical protein SBA3_770017 [Candidatus Sulfopaludibacter sp. SbA3]|nr:hypothetical protein SBA3_770017 [Candidatus Sulfopaludibacter sp. SbA3]